MTPEAPHSRACGVKPHSHGSDCHPNCPTCHGKPEAAVFRVVVAEVTATVVKPGDRVLVALHRDDYTPEAIQAIREQLGEHFPDQQFVLVAGASVAVAREDS